MSASQESKQDEGRHRKAVRWPCRRPAVCSCSLGSPQRARPLGEGPRGPAPQRGDCGQTGPSRLGPWSVTRWGHEGWRSRWGGLRRGTDRRKPRGGNSPITLQMPGPPPLRPGAPGTCQGSGCRPCTQGDERGAPWQAACSPKVSLHGRTIK